MLRFRIVVAVRTENRPPQKVASPTPVAKLDKVFLGPEVIPIHHVLMDLNCNLKIFGLDPVKKDRLF